MSDLSRRVFAESLALGALAPLLNASPGGIRLADWTSASSSETTKPAGALAQALTQAIRAQYGSRLSAKDLRTIAQQIQVGLERVDQLRKVKLSNGDEPDFVFTPSQSQVGTRG